MYASVRRYGTSSAKEVTERVKEGFVPIISQGPGFVAYYAIDSGDGVWTSVSIFETQAGAEESNRMAADWIKQNVASLLSGSPEITAGELVVSKRAGTGSAQAA